MLADIVLLLSFLLMWAAVCAEDGDL